MTRYELAIAAADWLEQNPRMYAFNEGHVPPTDKYERCILGEIGVLTGMYGAPVNQVALKQLGMGEQEFYDMMALEHNGIEFDWRRLGTWVSSAATAAQVLRRVADKHLRLPKPTYYNELSLDMMSRELMRITRIPPERQIVSAERRYYLPIE